MLLQSNYLTSFSTMQLLVFHFRGLSVAGDAVTRIQNRLFVSLTRT